MWQTCGSCCEKHGLLSPLVRRRGLHDDALHVDLHKVEAGEVEGIEHGDLHVLLAVVLQHVRVRVVLLDLRGCALRFLIAG